MDINVPEQGVIAFPPLIEATREFQIQTSLFNAEYGRFSGSIVNFVTKSGTNQWHGSVYEYFRNDALDANDFFNNANGLPRTVLKQNQFGVSIGGPIHRNSHFVFGNWEANKLRQGTGPFASNVPTAAQRSGSLNYNTFTDTNGNGRFDAGEPTAPATLNLAGSIAPISRAVLDGFIPLPNANIVGANYIANGIQKMDEDAFAIRTDHSLTSKDQVSVRYAYDDQRQFYPFDIFFTAASLPAFPFPNPERRQSVAVAHTHIFGSSVTNEFRFGLNRQRNPIPNGTEIDPASIGLPNGVVQNEFGRGLPIIRVTGFGGTGGQPFTVTVGAFDRRVPEYRIAVPIKSAIRTRMRRAGFAFNPAAFVAPSAATVSRCGRIATLLRADSYFNTDFAALRNFRFSPLGEAGAIEFRTEFFNPAFRRNRQGFDDCRLKFRD